MRRPAQDLAAEPCVRPVQANHDRHVRVDADERFQDALRHQVATRDAAEDVDQDGLDRGVRQDDLERRGHGLDARAAPDIQEVRGLGAGLRHDVQRRHHQPRAVADDPDLAVELHVLQAGVPGAGLDRVDGERRAELLEIGVAPQRVVVDRDLRVQRHDRAVLEQDERVDLDERGVVFAQDRVELADDVGRTLARLERQRSRELAHVVHPQAQHRVDVHAPDRLRARPRELLDVHATLGRHHREVIPVARSRTKDV